MDTVLARVRGRSRVVAPKRFVHLAVVQIVALMLVVATGAVVRLTASGLGCDNWPRCGDKPYPEKGGHAVIEFGNRVIALAAISIALVCWLASRRVAGLPPSVRRLSLAVFLGMVAQIPLGGLTVVFHLDPLLVMSHFLLTFVVLGCATIVLVEACSFAWGRTAPIGSGAWRALGMVVALSCLALVVTGAVATAAGPHSGGDDIPRLGVLVRDAVYVHVRANAVYGIALLGFGGLLLTRWRAHLPGLVFVAASLLAVLLAQMAIGEIQYREALPWWLVVIHVSFAGAIWMLTVALVYIPWRPPRILARGNGSRAGA